MSWATELFAYKTGEDLLESVHVELATGFLNDAKILAGSLEVRSLRLRVYTHLRMEQDFSVLMMVTGFSLSQVRGGNHLIKALP